MKECRGCIYGMCNLSNETINLHYWLNRIEYPFSEHQTASLLSILCIFFPSDFDCIWYKRIFIGKCTTSLFIRHPLKHTTKLSLETLIQTLSWKKHFQNVSRFFSQCDLSQKYKSLHHLIMSLISGSAGKNMYFKHAIPLLLQINSTILDFFFGIKYKMRRKKPKRTEFIIRCYFSSELLKSNS